MAVGKTKYAALACACSVVALMSQSAAQAADDKAQGGIQQIVVTASKRSQSIQDVSMAITAVGADKLQSGHIGNLEDLQAIAPSLTMGDEFNVAKVFMRGIGTNTSVAGSEAGVALYVDGAFIARPEAQLTSLFDLDRVEVLRGPQGTLYGRNAVGGAVNLITAKPTSDLQGYAHLTYGSYNMLNVEGALSGPISNMITARVAFKSESRDGYGHNPLTGSDVNDLNRRMARLEVNFRPNESFNWLVSGEYFRSNDASGVLQYGGPAFPDPNNPSGPPLFTPSGVGGYATDVRDTAGDFDPFVRTRTWAVTSTMDWKVNDWLTIADIFNYRDFGTTWGQDLDLSAKVNDATTGFGNQSIQRFVGSEPQFSNELQFKTDASWVKGVLGYYYFAEDMTGSTQFGGDGGPLFGPSSYLDVIQNNGLDPLDLLKTCGIGELAYSPARADGRPNPVTTFCGASEHKTEAWAVFGQYVFPLGELIEPLQGVSLKLGGRYSRERRTVENPAVIIAPPNVIQVPVSASSNERKFDDFTPEIGIEWQPSGDFMFYYTYSEGFKSGVGELIPASNVIVGPEKIQNHEFGIKTAWLDHSLIVNVAGFMYELQGLQISKSEAAANSVGFVQRFENAANVSAHGVEADIMYHPTDWLRFNGSVAYLDSKFTDFTTADPLDPANIVNATTIGTNSAIIQLAGNPTRDSPKWSSYVGVELDWHGLQLPANGYLTFSASASYKDDTYFSEFARFLEGQKAFTLVDTSVEYKSPDTNVTASFWVKNLTDELVRGGTFGLVTNGTIGVTYLPPRTYGVSVGYKF